jgi:hypothetical protein
MNVIVVMVVYVLQVQLVGNYANVLMDLLARLVNYQFVSFIESLEK